MSNANYRAISEENYQRFKTKFKEKVIDEIIKIENLIPGTFVDAEMNAAGDRLILTRMDETTVEIPIDGGAGNIEVGDVTDVTITPKHGRVLLTWTDPGNVVVEGATLARWAGTLVVRKAGSMPTTKTDGTVVVDSTTRNAYASTPYVDSGLTDGTTYYYRFFPHTTGLAYTPGTTASATPDRETVEIPTASGQLTYTGSYQEQAFNNYDSTKMNRTGDTGGTDADEYGTTFSLLDDYKWSDGTITDKLVEWTIARADIANVPSQSGTIEYDGTEHEVTWQDYDSTKMTVSGDTAGTNAGTYTATFTPDSNHAWSNGSTAARNVAWEIGRQAVAATPAQSGTLTYDTTEQEPTWTGYDNTKMTVSGDTEGTNAGTYTATFTLGSNYKWPNGDTEPLDVSWVIQKTTGSITLSEASISLDTSTLSDTFTVTRAGDGTISVSSSDSTVATASLSGTTVTVEAVDSGSAVVTVSVAAGTNYEAVTKDIAVTVALAPVVSSTLNDNSWDVISTVSQSGDGDTYWDVGDCKEITLNGKIGANYTASNQKLCVFILDFNHKDNNAASNNIIWGGFKTALTGGKDVALMDFNDGSYPSKTDGTKQFNFNHWGNYNYGGWKGSDLRYDILGATSTAPSGYGSAKTTSCVGYDATAATLSSPKADTFLAALPSDLRSKIRLRTHYVDNKGNSSNVDANVTAVTDAVFLLAEFEIFGTRSYANQYEQNHQAQMKYYKDGNSKIKYESVKTGTAASWWEASPGYDGAGIFCIVYGNGNTNGNSARIALGLAPAFMT